MYPRHPTDPSTGPSEFLNSGMWMGPVHAVRELLRTMTGVARGEKIETLLRHYHHWGTLDTKADPIPPAYNENDQVKYAGLYVAQEIAAACAHGRPYRARGSGCFKFLHDYQRRCASGCQGASSAHSLQPRMGLDRGLRLFENMYKAGQHRLDGATGGAEKVGTGRPLVVHFNGPAKVVFEAQWELPWDATAGKTPVLQLVEGLRRSRSRAERRAAAMAFETNVTFIDPWLRRAPGIGPLRFGCEVPW